MLDCWTGTTQDCAPCACGWSGCALLLDDEDGSAAAAGERSCCSDDDDDENKADKGLTMQPVSSPALP